MNCAVLGPRDNDNSDSPAIVVDVRPHTKHTLDQRTALPTLVIAADVDALGATGLSALWYR